MTPKRISIGGRPSQQLPLDSQQWVDERQAQSEKEKMKRLTIDVSESLNRLIKTDCAQRGVKIADEVRAMLIQKYDKTQNRLITSVFNREIFHSKGRIRWYLSYVLRELLIRPHPL